MPTARKRPMTTPFGIRRWPGVLVTLAVALMTAGVAMGADADAEALRAKVYAEYPQLADGKLDDFSRVCLIRQWAWSHTPIAASASNLLDNRSDIDWWHLDAAATFKLFEQDRGGVFCGGTAVALQRLYESFGYTAWTVDSGDSKSYATHVVTLVRIKVDQRPVLCVQDAYFNLTYVDRASGRALDYFEMLGRLSRGQHESVRTVVADYHKIPVRPVTIVAAKDVANRPAKDIASACWSVQAGDYTVSTLADGSLKFVSPRDVGKFLGQLCHTRDGRPAWYLKWLVAQGHPPQIMYLYLYPLGIGGPDSQAMLGRAKAIVGGG